MTGRTLPFIVALVLSGLAVGVGAWLGSDVEEQWQLATRYTARASFPLLLLVYTASSLARLWPGKWQAALARNRRQWGLGFALSHTIHLGALTWYSIMIRNMPGTETLIGGGLAYALMFAMAASSNDASVKALGKWWKRVHTIGIHWLWFIFTFSYFGKIFEAESRTLGLVAFGLCVAALALRIAARRR